MRITVTARTTAFPDGPTSEAHCETIDQLLAELLPLSGRVVAPGDNACGPIAIAVRHIPTFSGEVDLDPDTSVIFRTAPIAILEFTSEVELAESAVFENFWVPRKDRPYSLEMFARRRVDEAIASLVFAICLAMPFRIQIAEPRFLPENEPIGSSVRWSDVGRGAHAAEMGWPKLHQLPLVNVLNWLDRLPGFRDGIGCGPVGRAVAALSQAFAAERGSPPGLIWSMVGLEALYCRSTEGLKRQLAHNSQLFLGPIPSHKKHFGMLYDYRSQFLHGSVDLPLAHRQRESDEDVWQFIWRSDDEAGLAGIVLLGSVQELIRRNWQSLDFTTSVIGAPDA